MAGLIAAGVFTGGSADYTAGAAIGEYSSLVRGRSAAAGPTSIQAWSKREMIGSWSSTKTHDPYLVSFSH